MASYDNDCQALLKRNPTGAAKACNRPLEGENFCVTTALERLGSVFKNAEGEVAVLRPNDDGFDWPDNVPPSAHGASQRRSIWHQKIGDCKTEASAKPVPLDGYMAEDLLQWRKKSPYPMQEDWVFASPTMKGEQPYWPDNLMKRHIKPAAKAAGIHKNIGWHTFRHSFGTLLKANGKT